MANLYLLHGKPLEKAKKMLGVYRFRNYVLEITNVPTRKRPYGHGYIIFKNRFNDELWKGTTLALENYILKFFYKRMKKLGIGWLAFQRPTSALIPRSGISFDESRDKVMVKFHFTVPSRGKAIDGKRLEKVFSSVIPKTIDELFKSVEAKSEEILANKLALEDQMEIRRFLLENDYVAFIENGLELGGKKFKVRNPERIRVKNAKRVYGLLIPKGRVVLKNVGVEFLELLAKGYAYYKKENILAHIKTIGSIGWISSGEEDLASYAGLDAVISVEDTNYPSAIVLDSQRKGDFEVLFEKEIRTTYHPRGVLEKMPDFKQILIKKPMKRVKLRDDFLAFENNKVHLPYFYSASIVERNQLRALVEALNFSQKYVNGRLDIRGIVSRTMNVINKKGLGILGLGFYTEFTTWQLFYLLCKLARLNT